jgi:hypothetical protein
VFFFSFRFSSVSTTTKRKRARRKSSGGGTPGVVVDALLLLFFLDDEDDRRKSTTDQRAKKTPALARCKNVVQKRTRIGHRVPPRRVRGRVARENFPSEGVLWDFRFANDAARRRNLQIEANSRRISHASGVRDTLGRTRRREVQHG